MKSPVSHMNVIVARRPRHRDRRTPTLGEDGLQSVPDGGGLRGDDRDVVDGGLHAAQPTRTYVPERQFVRSRRRARGRLDRQARRRHDAAPRDRQAGHGVDEHVGGERVREPDEALERAVDAEARAGGEPHAVAVGDRGERGAAGRVELDPQAQPARRDARSATPGARARSARDERVAARARRFALARRIGSAPASNSTAISCSITGLRCPARRGRRRGGRSAPGSRGPSRSAGRPRTSCSSSRS